MRITGGRFGSRKIAAPSGRSTRPTHDRAREGLFNRLEAHGAIEGARVLDGFAGSGALGIEALSRGASHVTFVERDARAIRVLKSNLETFGILDIATINKGDMFSERMYSRSCEEPFSLILLDPPYRIDKSEVKRLLENLGEAGGLLDGAFVVWEHDSSSNTDWPSRFVSLGTRSYGTTGTDIAVYHKEEE